MTPRIYVPAGLVIEQLRSATCCRLKPSLLAPGGVGVFAIRPIAAGARLFVSPLNGVRISATELATLPDGVRRLAEDFGMTYEGVLYLPTMDMHAPDFGMFVNHADAPNCELQGDEEGETEFLVTLREIAEGEELGRDYERDGTDFILTREEV